MQRSFSFLAAAGILMTGAVAGVGPATAAAASRGAFAANNTGIFQIHETRRHFRRLGEHRPHTGLRDYSARPKHRTNGYGYYYHYSPQYFYYPGSHHPSSQHGIIFQFSYGGLGYRW